MDRFAKFFCDPVKVVKSIASAALCVGVLVYVYLQVMGGVDSDIVTETAMHVTLNDSVSAEACIFRDETVSLVPEGGNIVTLVSEGDRVSKGQLIANIYPDVEDAVLQDDINRINRQIEIIEDSSVDSSFIISDLHELDNDIDALFDEVYYSAANGEIAEVISDSSDLLVKLNKRDLIVESDFDYSQKLEALVAEKQRLEGQIHSLSTPVLSTSAGYFFGDVDGYENVFDISDIDSMSLSDFEQLLEKEADETLADSGSVKIVNDFIWYLACFVDSEKAATLVQGRKYTLVFPESADEEMGMTLYRVVSEINSSTAVVVFRVNVLPPDFSYKRFQPAEIVLTSLEGISVPKKALRVVDGVEGVYILVGDVVRFRAVERIAEKDGYYVAKLKTNKELFEESVNDDVLVKSLSLYDNIIVSGKDLFDGKIVG